MQKEQLLNQKIVSIPFTQELKNILHSEDIATLKQLLDLQVHEWHQQLPGFNYHHQYEVIKYVTDNKLDKFLKDS